jgi:hypothetical protein
MNTITDEKHVQDLRARLCRCAQGITLGAEGMGWSVDHAVILEAADALAIQAAKVAELEARIAELEAQAAQPAQVDKLSNALRRGAALDNDAMYEARAESVCSMGVGCETAGVCYAGAVGRPEMCGRVDQPAQVAAPTQAEAEPLRGWKMNHCQAHPTDEGVWEIGYLDAEDNCFSPMLTIDTGLYYQADQAERLARSVLACLIAAAPKREGGAA